jgi:hypothetical protein
MNHERRPSDMTDQSPPSSSLMMTRSHATSSPSMAMVPTRRLRSLDNTGNALVSTRRINNNHQRNHFTTSGSSSHACCHRDRPRLSLSRSQSHSHTNPPPGYKISSSPSLNCCSFQMSVLNKSHSTKSSSLSSLPQHPAIQRIAPISTNTPPPYTSRPGASRSSTGRTSRHSPSPPASSRPRSGWRVGHGPTRSLSHESHALSINMTRSNSNPTASEMDGLPSPKRSMTYHPAPSAGAAYPARASAPRAFTEDGVLRGETLSFVPMPDLLRSRLGSPTDDLSPSLSRSSSQFSTRTPMYTPSSPRPPTDCISYFPPYEGSVDSSMDVEETEEDDPNQEEIKEETPKRHSRGSSISAFASAIISAMPFVRSSPAKSTVPLPTTSSDAESESSTKPAFPGKLTPVPTSEWPCGSLKDKKRRKDSENEVDKMMLATVKREGPRNKDELDDVDSLLMVTVRLLKTGARGNADYQSRSSKRRPQLTLPMPTKTWHPALPSPPVAAISPITAAPVVEFATPARGIVSIIQSPPQDTSVEQSFEPVSNPANTVSTPSEIIKPTDQAHIPTHHRGRSSTLKNGASTETSQDSTITQASHGAPPIYSSPTKSRGSVVGLFPGLTIDTNLPKPAVWPSDSDGENEDDEEGDGDITPKAGRDGWIKREVSERGSSYLQLP